MQIVREIKELRRLLGVERAKGKRLALVPTMGALHPGHISLVHYARQFAEIVAVSIFVNPLQFNSSNDLAQYPRLEEQDLRMAHAAGVDLVFLPALSEIYSSSDPAHSVCIKAGDRALGLCGASRPGHFDGVVTVVSILFNIFTPEIAVFGEKDYQQCKVIEQLRNDLQFPVELKFAPLVRDHDGLALSSRNLRLSLEQRQAALAIPKALFDARDAVAKGECDSAAIISAVRTALRELKIDYVEVVNVDTLKSVTKISDQAQLLVAAFAGQVRLIDNIRLQAPDSRGR